MKYIEMFLQWRFITNFGFLIKVKYLKRNLNIKNDETHYTDREN